MYFDILSVPDFCDAERLFLLVKKYYALRFNEQKNGAIGSLNGISLKNEIKNCVRETVEKCVAEAGGECCGGCCEKSAKEKSRQAGEVFESKLDELFEFCKTDVEAVIKGDPSAENEKIVFNVFPGFLAITVYRMAHVFYEMRVPYLPRVLTEYAHSRTGIDINAGAKIGKNFLIDHGTGVVIGETAVIGDNCRIYQGVTIGALSLKAGSGVRGEKRHPTIGNGVIIYANATILGGNTVIGDDCVIGGNAFVIKSVPAGTKVLSRPTSAD